MKTPLQLVTISLLAQVTFGKVICSSVGFVPLFFHSFLPTTEAFSLHQAWHGSPFFARRPERRSMRSDSRYVTTHFTRSTLSTVLPFDPGHVSS